MHSPLPQQLLDQALVVIEHCRPLVDAIRRRDRDLADQLRRALSSVALNVSEAFGAMAGNSRLRFQTALGSLYESRAALRVAVAWGHVSNESCTAPLAAIDHLAARLYGTSRR
jgi:four helix bundle protein